MWKFERHFAECAEFDTRKLFSHSRAEGRESFSVLTFLKSEFTSDFCDITSSLETNYWSNMHFMQV